MLTLYHARESVDKERFLYSQVQGETIVIVPDQYTLIAEEQALRHLGTACLLDVEILSMSRLGMRVLTEQGRENVRVLDRFERYMVLASVIQANRDALEIFRKAADKRSFVEMVHDFIADCKQQGCTLDQIDAMIGAEETDEILRRKLRELRLIAGAYEETIRKSGHRDNEDYITMYTEAIGASEWLRGKQVWVYGFDSMTPKMIRALMEIALRADDVRIMINESDFGLGWILSARLRKEAEECGISWEDKTIPEAEWRLPKSPVIEKIERELFRMGGSVTAAADAGEDLRIVECANPHYEAETAAAYICGLLRTGHFEMKEIVMICNDAQTMQPVIRRTFAEYGLPVFLDASRSIRDTQTAVFLVSQLEAIRYDFRTSSILTMLKSGLTDLPEEAVWDLENYVRDYQIRGRMWTAPFRYGEKECGETLLASVNEIREVVAERLGQLQKLVRESETVQQFTEQYFRYLNDTWHLRDTVEALRDHQLALGRAEESQRTVQSYNEAIRVLDRVRDILGEEPMEIGSFLSLFSEGINGAEIGLIPPTLDGLSLGTMIRTRPAPPKAVVILGANEGILPMEPPTEGLFSVDEKNWFEQRDFALGSLDNIRMMEENTAMYRLLSRPSDKLYISYSLTNGSGNDLKPSSLIGALRRLFPGLRISRDVISSGYDIGQIHSKMEALRHTVGYCKDDPAGSRNGIADADYVAEGVFRWFEQNDPELLQRVMDAGRDENRVGPLPTELVRRLYTRKGRDFSFSASRLEKQYRCPFEHFISYGLAPQEPREFRGGSREIGDIYHECIMRVSRRLMSARGEGGQEAQEGLNPAFTQESLAAMVDEELHTLSEEYRGGLFLSGGRETYRMERIREICEEAVRVLAEQLRNGSLRLAFFEERFGRGCRFEPIEYTLHGEKVYIEGKIDRVDILEGGNVRIVDYKTGQDRFDLEQMRKGYKMQLAVYLQGAESGTYGPAGMFYFNISDAELKANGLSQDKQEQELRKQEENYCKLKGAYINEPVIVASMPADAIDRSSLKMAREEFEQLEQDVHKSIELISDSIVRGDISISPAKLQKGSRESECRYCQYRAICKFDPSYRGNNYHMV